MMLMRVACVRMDVFVYVRVHLREWCETCGMNEHTPLRAEKTRTVFVFNTPDGLLVENKSFSCTTSYVDLDLSNRSPPGRGSSQ